DGKSTAANPYGWNENTNLLLIDQPTGTGFSYGTPVTNSTAAAADFVALLLLFYRAHPEYYGSGLHLFGESFSGHYIPAIGSAILEHNSHATRQGICTSDPSRVYIPLESVGIGNGLINPRSQFKYYSKMACDSTYPPVLAQTTCDIMDQSYPKCAEAIDGCYSGNQNNTCAKANEYCGWGIQAQYTLYNPDNNPYDVRNKCAIVPLCYASTEKASQFLNTTAVQQALHAKEMPFQPCSRDVFIAFNNDNDILRSYDDELANMLNAGAAALEMSWRGKSLFNVAPDAPWKVGSASAGELRSVRGLSFLRIYEAGHMVPMDQPKAALQMLNSWVANRL
ncbi:hypothetical protein LPJ61_005573, partial [Coemansia biformis]